MLEQQDLDFIVCPKCGSISRDPDDINERYCGKCRSLHELLYDRVDYKDLLKHPLGIWVDCGYYYNLRHEHCLVSWEKRPGYCDRGRYLVNFEGDSKINRFLPKFGYYFTHEIISQEVNDWLKLAEGALARSSKMGLLDRLIDIVKTEDNDLSVLKANHPLLATPWQTIVGENCSIHIFKIEDPFTYYLCDLEVNPGTDPRVLSVDYADGFPRVYLTSDNAIIECYRWLDCRKQAIN